MEKIGYEHTLLSVDEILSMKASLLSGDIISIVLVSVCIVGGIFIIMYIFPALSSMKKEYYKQKEKGRKKDLIRQISLQREIEEEVEKSL